MWLRLRSLARVMSTPVDRVISHVGAVAEYVAAQRSAGCNSDATLESQAKALATQIASIASMTIQDATRVLTTIRGSVFTYRQKTLLADATDARRSLLTSTAASCGTSGKTQSCDNFEHFLLQSDWDAIATSSPSIVVGTIAHRAVKWGLSCPSEKLLGRMAAIVCVEYMKSRSPHPKTLHNLKASIQLAIKNKAKVTPPYPFPHETRLPLRPSECEPDVRHYACGADVPISPSDDFVAALNAIMKIRFLRRSATSLKDDAMPWQRQPQQPFQAPQWQWNMCTPPMWHSAPPTWHSAPPPPRPADFSTRLALSIRESENESGASAASLPALPELPALPAPPAVTCVEKPVAPPASQSKPGVEPEIVSTLAALKQAIDTNERHRECEPAPQNVGRGTGFSFSNVPSAVVCSRLVNYCLVLNSWG